MEGWLELLWVRRRRPCRAHGAAKFPCQHPDSGSALRVLIVIIFRSAKGASGPRKGQKSTCHYNSVLRTNFLPVNADLGLTKGSSSCRSDASHPIRTSITSNIKRKICSGITLSANQRRRSELENFIRVSVRLQTLKFSTHTSA